MSQKLSPWIETAYGWVYGENGWNTGMDSNLLKFSVLFDCNVDSIVASLPAAVNGKVHYLTSDNRLYFAVGSTYFSTSLPRWFEFKDRLTGDTYQFNGTTAVTINSPTQIDTRLNAVELTLTSLGSAAYEDVEFFATQADLDIVEASSQAYADTLRSDLTANTGAGLVGFNNALTYPPDTIGNEVKYLQTLTSVNIENFGGVADGVTDNMPALISALAASPVVTFPERAGVWRFSSTGTHTLTRDIEIDFNGQKLEFSNARLILTGAVVASGRTLAANVARYAKSITLNNGADIQAGDLAFIGTDQLPSSDWPDKKNDCVRIRSISGAVATLDEGLNFSYATGDTGLAVTIYRPFKARLVRPKILTIAADADTTGYVNILCTGLRDVELVSPEFTGQYPFDRANNIYRNGLWFFRSIGLKITNMVCEAMSYPVGVYGGARNVLEIGTTARYMHHSHADIGGWGSDYRLQGLHSSDSFQGLNTHPCFRAYADGFTVLNDTGLSNWRCCGGGISNGFISSSVDDTSELPQFQNSTPNVGYVYINSDADFYADNVTLDYPNRVTKPGLAVRYGRSAKYSNYRGSATAGLSGGELQLFICGPGNRFGTSGTAILPASHVYAVTSRLDVPQFGVPVVASASTLNLPLNSAGAYVTGNTTIANIGTDGFEGRTIALVFDGNITVTDGGNLRLAGDFVTGSSFRTLNLFCRSAVWYEVSRSLN